MNPWMALDPVWSPEWLWLTYATALRASVVLAVVAAAALLLRRAPAPVRALLWVTALLALLPLPIVRALPLYWTARVVPAPLASPMVAIGTTMVEQSAPGAVPMPWTSVAGVVWLAGAAVVLLRLGWAAAAVARIGRRARPVTDRAWLAMLADARAAVGLRRPVRLLRSEAAGSPITWGTLRPAVLIPADADAWPPEHRRAVLLHELAHVRRLDCLAALVAHITCALWWFHPGAWWAASRLAAERERACDHRVLAAGVHPSDYAECLLAIADRARGGAHPALAAGLFRRSELRARVRAILQSPAPAPSRRLRIAGLAVAAGGAAVMLAVGSMRLSPRGDVLWAAFGSPEWSTRAYAAESIARFGEPGSVAALNAALQREPHPGVHAMARYGAHLRARSSPRPR